MNKIQKFALTVSILIAFFGCSDSDNSSEQPDQPTTDKTSCIHQNLAVETNTLDDVREACDASKDEVLDQLQPEVGTCDKSDLGFDKPINEIMQECDVSNNGNITIDLPSSSSKTQSSSSKTNSSSSRQNGGSSSSALLIPMSSFALPPPTSSSFAP